MKTNKILVPLLSAAILFPTAINVHANPQQPVSVKSVEFVGMQAPDTDAKRSSMYSEASAIVTLNDGTQKIVPLEYHSMAQPGDVINGKIVGAAYDVNGNYITDKNGKPITSTAPDMNTILSVNGKSGKLYMLNHFESMPKNEIGNVPKAMYLNTVEQNKKTGEMKITDITPVDFSADGGLWTPCAGVLSPWNTHLGSEEYEPNARVHEANPENSDVTQFARNYYQDPSVIGNPYLYGYTTEVKVHPNGEAKAVKHHSMGRLSFENVTVAPDNRTVYYGDDGSYTMSFMYIADKAKDLSAGTLYAAKWKQTSDQNGGAADIEWIKLGHANDQEIKEMAQNLKFSDIFETTNDAAYAQANGFKQVKAAGNLEWLKVKPGMEKAAAFLESRRYGALLGATAEFNKMETLTFNKADNKIYMAMSYIEKGMTKNPTDPADDIQLPKLSAGAIYEMDLAAGQKDRDGRPIDSDYVVTKMSGLITGEDLAVKDADGNRANPDKIANPDNIVFSEKYRTLFIAEDSNMHTNNFGWAYNVDTKKLSRIISAPDGGEVTGLQAVDELNGKSYLMVGSQNPGNIGYIDLTSLSAKE
ncbi:PhoX family phosphatase [Bacillus sp. FJAT-29814]|uniref:PhoX family protein n=1 Tax=Bacillus sp. FJAT-29814 TaxID=1729688 RepID=UPI00082FE0C3|nr:alkaline phosphatase PhoX [Bacillus sp. FJAT-29814]